MAYSEYSVSTSAGEMTLVLTDIHRVTVSFTCAVANQVKVRGSIWLEDYGTGLELRKNEYGRTHDAAHLDRVEDYNKEVSSSARAKLAKIAIEVARAFVGEHPEAMLHAGVTRIRENQRREDEAITELEAKLAAHTIKRDALAADLAEVQEKGYAWTRAHAVLREAAKRDAADRKHSWSHQDA